MSVMTYHRISKIPRSLILVLLCICIILSLPLHCGDSWCGLLGDRPSTPRPDIFVPKRPDVELVVAKMKREDTSWIGKYLPDWQHNTYVVDDPKAELTVSVNKGREAMVYLTSVFPHKAVVR
jgi:hypothetical protein